MYETPVEGFGHHQEVCSLVDARPSTPLCDDGHRTVVKVIGKPLLGIVWRGFVHIDRFHEHVGTSLIVLRCIGVKGIRCQLTHV